MRPAHDPRSLSTFVLLCRCRSSPPAPCQKANRWGDEEPTADAPGQPERARRADGAAGPPPFDAKAFAAQYPRATRLRGGGARAHRNPGKTLGRARRLHAAGEVHPHPRGHLRGVAAVRAQAPQRAAVAGANEVAMRGGPIDRDVKLLNEQGAPLPARDRDRAAGPLQGQARACCAARSRRGIGMQGETQTVKMAELQLGSTGQRSRWGPRTSPPPPTSAYAAGALAPPACGSPPPHYGRASARGSYEDRQPRTPPRLHRVHLAEGGAALRERHQPDRPRGARQSGDGGPLPRVNKELVVLARFDGVKTPPPAKPTKRRPQTVAVPDHPQVLPARRDRRVLAAHPVTRVGT